MTRVEVEYAIIGAGVIGLAIGAALARRGRAVFVLEAAPRPGSGISSRNSEVIHSGIYYPENSLKHLLCIEGRRRLYDYCERRGIAFRKCGKLIVATDDSEVSAIERLAERGRRNGVDELALIDGADARRMEPELRACAAIDAPQTGIVDSHAYMLALIGEIEDAGGALLTRHRVRGGRILSAERFEVDIDTASEPLGLATSRLVIAAGLHSHVLASRFDHFPVHNIPPLMLAKGSYFSYSGRPAFSRLIYPAPVDGGLGVHLTLDLVGRMRFGPDVEWLSKNDPDVLDLAVDAERVEVFHAAIQQYWPKVSRDRLVPDYSGVRPKLAGPGTFLDFCIFGPRDHEIGGLVALFGIESPGLTASPAIAEQVIDLLGE